ncbi:MAG: Coenzyme F420 hydrogenase/dehydrogenase, beta subunit C-terminal domain [Selenomonadaceae bacterium]|nr:Coenzyme F420 hydrogenase/dehydrogenase, beta subunit C-terminal domain [Selenomonadaceae bacterium]
MLKVLGERCAGCGACAQVCSQGAIEMQPNKEGFWYPQIIRERCIDCGRCYNVCPWIDMGDSSLFHPSPRVAYAIKSKSRDIQMQATSGGLFAELARKFIAAGGVAYGAGYNSSFQVRHLRTASMEETEQLSGSKYVQSFMGSVYALAKQDLQQGKKVLFSGTACQIAGLRKYLVKDYENLLCVDVICHGVPSPRIWEYYVEKQEKRGGKILEIIHRGKTIGGWSWRKQFFYLVFADGKVLRENIWENAYMLGFLKDLYLRPSCHECMFKRLDKRRVSDITLGDYWGCEDIEPDFFDASGVSLAIMNTLKGEQCLNEVENISKKVTNLEKAVSYNIAVMYSYRRMLARAYFFRKFHSQMSLEEFGRLVDTCVRLVGYENSLRKLCDYPRRILGKLKRMCLGIGAKS